VGAAARDDPHHPQEPDADAVPQPVAGELAALVGGEAEASRAGEAAAGAKVRQSEQRVGRRAAGADPLHGGGHLAHQVRQAHVHGEPVDARLAVQVRRNGQRPARGAAPRRQDGRLVRAAAADDAHGGRVQGAAGRGVPRGARPAQGRRGTHPQTQLGAARHGLAAPELPNRSPHRHRLLPHRRPGKRELYEMEYFFNCLQVENMWMQNLAYILFFFTS
jgi:hypothetical protein